VNATNNTPGIISGTALSMALQRRRGNVVEMLLNAGATINDADLRLVRRTLLDNQMLRHQDRVEIMEFDRLRDEAAFMEFSRVQPMDSNILNQIQDFLYF
jgi:hypothetical protein